MKDTKVQQPPQKPNNLLTFSLALDQQKLISNYYSILDFFFGEVYNGTLEKK
jgi:hypothetical protein